MHFTRFRQLGRIAAMTKPGKMHCVIRIKPTGEQVKMRRKVVHWGSWDTVKFPHKPSFSRVST